MSDSSKTNAPGSANPADSANKAEAAPDKSTDVRRQAIPNLAKDQTVISSPIVQPTGSSDAPFPGAAMANIGNSLIGQTLGHFLLEEFIGGGGMGVVFRATDLQLERTVAVKVLTYRHGSDEDTVRRFKVEAQSAARLNHENIADVYFVGEDQGWNFIVFEYIEGENIRDVVAKAGPLPIAKAIDIIAQTAAALDHAAAREVVHRDIKPSNILLTYEGRAKLVDMGLARLQQVEAVEDLTVSGVTLGTFDYISPEQGRDPRDADTRSDLYSLGCTFYFMLTGQAPFPRGTVLQKLLSHTSDAIPDPSVMRPEVPVDFVNIIATLMAKQPEERYQHPSTLIADLKQAAIRNQLRFQSSPSWLTDTFGSGKAMQGRLFRTTLGHQLLRLVPFAIPLLCLLAVAWCVNWFFPTTDPNLPRFRPPAEAEAGRVDPPESSSR